MASKALFVVCMSSASDPLREVEMVAAARRAAAE